MNTNILDDVQFKDLSLSAKRQTIINMNVGLLPSANSAAGKSPAFYFGCLKDTIRRPPMELIPVRMTLSTITTKLTPKGAFFLLLGILKTEKKILDIYGITLGVLPDIDYMLTIIYWDFYGHMLPETIAYIEGGRQKVKGDARLAHVDDVGTGARIAIPISATNQKKVEICNECGNFIDLFRVQIPTAIKMLKTLLKERMKITGKKTKLDTYTRLGFKVALLEKIRAYGAIVKTMKAVNK